MGRWLGSMHTQSRFTTLNLEGRNTPGRVAVVDLRDQGEVGGVSVALAEAGARIQQQHIAGLEGHVTGVGLWRWKGGHRVVSRCTSLQGRQAS